MTPTDLAALPSAAQDRDGWIAALAEMTEETGDFVTLGDRHWALFVDEAPTLIVSFETLADVQARPDQLPLAHDIAAEHGWSCLCIIADGPTWWRDPAVWRYFDRLVDDAFFEDFDRVLFTGAGMGGYAACAFSVAAPGATVLAFAPCATQDPEQVAWDRRDPAARRLDFRSRYGYAPDMLEGVGQAFIVLDPTQPLDHMHAALFHAPWVTRLNMRHSGSKPAATLSEMGLLNGLIADAAKGSLTAHQFAVAWRKRRDYSAYLRRLITITDSAGQLVRSEAICRNVLSRKRMPRIRRRLEQIQSQRAGKRAKRQPDEG